ncbi:MAG: Omp28 family outer membrane lipoprotein [Bacteroidales bacterium]|nr:Omp28 family outer membrane lipoprotein [Bacteroidales bacterium]
MKTTKYIGGFILAGLLPAFVACDKIKDGDRLIDQGVVEIKSERCVLLEDYTGVRCVNCPDAAATTKLLQATYGNNLIVVALHPQGFPTLTMPYDEDQDLSTAIARTYYDAFQISSLPQGMVNRKKVLPYLAWGGAIQEVFDDTSTDYVNLVASAKLSGTNMQVNINGNFKQDYSAEGDINVIAMVVENNITTQQNSHEGRIKEYVHNHVLRTVISDDVWGDKILDAHPSEGADFTKQYTATLNEAWKTQDLALVVAVVNARSREVLQAAYAHFK